MKIEVLFRSSIVSCSFLDLYLVLTDIVHSDKVIIFGDAPQQQTGFFLVKFHVGHEGILVTCCTAEVDLQDRPGIREFL